MGKSKMGSREIENLNLFYFLLISLLRWGIRQLVNELKATARVGKPLVLQKASVAD